jgi:branched-chain amino acid aminotransferase
MNECSGNYFILNGSLQPSELFDNSMVYDGESVYEVLRIIKGLPVFFDDHADRLLTSAKLRKKVPLADMEMLRRDIIMLSESGKKSETNLKIVFNYSESGSKYLVYHIEPIYPSPEQYRKGVKGILYSAERNEPESKVINHKLRSEIYHKLILENAYEAILVNRKNCITEGSRSNIFFISGNRLFTAPDKSVLGGITRKHLLEISLENNIPVEFICAEAGRISEYESVFMTGTSPVVLPFHTIGTVRFSVRHHFIPLLRNLCMARAEESMKKFRGRS